MGKIILTSVGANVLKKIIKKLKIKPAELTVLFIPTAANQDKNKCSIINDKNELIRARFKIIECDISHKRKKELESISKNIDIIYVAGGNTFYLLQEMRKTGFDQILKNLIDSNIIYIGSSAGSAILSPTIEYVKYFDDPEKAPELKSFEGLNILNFLLLPHFDKTTVLNKFKELRKEFDKFKFVTISDDEFVLIDKKKIRIIR